QLVTTVDNAPDEVGPPLGNPAKHEERAARVVTLQQTEETVHPHVDPALDRFPGRARDVRLQGGDLEVLLHVDGEMVVQLRASTRRRIRGAYSPLLDCLHGYTDLACGKHRRSRQRQCNRGARCPEGAYKCVSADRTFIYGIRSPGSQS